MADARGRGKDYENRDYPQRDFLLFLQKKLKDMDIDDLKEKYSGEKLGGMIREKQIRLIREERKGLNHFR